MKKSKIKILTTTLLCTLTASSVATPLLQTPINAYANAGDMNVKNEDSSEKDNSNEGTSDKDTYDKVVSDKDVSEILKNQQEDGGWKKDYSINSGDWSHSTIDSNSTCSEIRKLAEEFKKTNNKKYSDAIIKGINFLLDLQYENGGWAQISNGSDCYADITFNNNDMINVLYLLDEIANKKGDFAFLDASIVAKAKASVEKGVQFILKTQVVVDGKLTAWGQLYDKDTLKLTTGGNCKFSALCSAESAAIIKFLSTREATAEITASIEAAVKWFNDCKITGIDVIKTDGDIEIKTDANSKKGYWALFYEIGTNKPIFGGLDGKLIYKLSDITKEIRGTHDWYGTWGDAILDIKADLDSSASVDASVKASANGSAKASVDASAKTSVDASAKASVDSDATVKSEVNSNSGNGIFTKIKGFCNKIFK